ncbi:MAG TPA: autotransporter-associated beta strand repeat-containing protein [Sphingopyxis sp.]|uniref:autotransporter-associated beta strand repeat-containing protein n=1 Tax=Sphingopyxis sp. TaxID=1908224 RepID=UPI002BDE7518|nr:autotransporter-associated beta strand repeat-containing protein [Sphingopyxis sp.]HWW56266.1 autotransporter-associated beta strand repeat-containing protein [Sphingopyxis sp.]
MRSNSLRRTLAAGTALGTHGFAAVGLSLALMAAPGVARAQINNYWLGGDGRWADASEWSEGVPPNSTLDARVQTGDDIAIDTPDARVGALWLESAESAPARAVVTSGGTLSAGYVMIGELPNQSGELVVDGPGAKALVTGYVVLGRNGGDATVAVTNGGLIQTGVTQAFGNGGQARLVVDGAQSELRTGLLQLRGSGAAPALVQIAAGGTVNASTLMLEGDVRISLNDGVLAADDVSVTGGANEIAVTTTGTLRLDTRIREFGGTLSLVKMGTGTLQLTGDHAYSGATTISQGIVRALGADRNSIGDASAVTIAAGATLALTGGGGAAGIEDDDETIGSLAGSGTVALGAQTLTVGANNANTIFSGSITGTGSLRKTGTGTLTLAASNNYSGGTTVADGTLVLQANEAIGQGPLTLTGGTLVANAAIQQVSALSGTGAIQVNNSLTVNQATDTLYAGTVSGTGALWKAGAGQLTLAGALSGGLRVNVSSGTLALSAANSYTGGTAIGNGAKVIVGYGQALGTGVISVFASGGGQVEAGANVTLANAIVINRAPANANLAITGDHDLRLNGVISTGGSGTGGGLIKRGNGVLSLAATNTYSGGTVIEGGAIRLLNDRALGTGAIRMAGGTALSFSGSPWQTLGALTLDGNVTLDVDQFQDAALNRTISGAGGFTKTGLGTLSLYGDNSFGGDIHVREGRLWVDNWAGVGNRAITDTALVTVDAGATIAFQKSEVFGALSGAGLVDITYAGELGLTVGGANTDFTFAGNISGGDPVSPNFPSYGLTKIGSGTFTLTGASDSRAGVYVGAGMLGVEGSIASSLVDVGVGGRLGGGGSVAGTVQLYRDGTLVGAAGRTLSMGGLIMNRGAILDVTLGAPSNDALFDVAGDIRLDGMVNVADGGGFGAAGVYRLISYTGTRSGNGLTIGSLPGGVDRASLSVQTGVAGQVNLISSAGVDLRFWDGGDPARHFNGAVDGGAGIWRLGDRTWAGADGSINGSPTPPGFAVFQGTGGRVTLDDAAGALSVTGMQFAADGYSLSGSALALVGSDGHTVIRVGDGTAAGAAITTRIYAPLTGATALVKSDAGTLILGGANIYSGGTVIEGGVLSISSDDALGAAGGGITFSGGSLATTAGLSTDRAVVLDSTGTFSTADGTALTLNGALSGAGGLVKRGAGELILSAANSYAGDTIVEAGTLSGNVEAIRGNLSLAGTVQFTQQNDADFAGNIAALGSNSGRAVKAGIGTLSLVGTSNVRWSVDEGGLVTAASRFTGDAAVASGASLRLEDVGDASYAGVLSGNGSIVKAGTERLTLTGDSAAFTGATSLEAGRLIIDGSLGGSLAVASGSTLEGKGRVGDVRVADGGRLAGGAGAPLTLSSLELDSAAQVGVALGTPGQAALFDITGDLTLDGTLNLTDAGGFGAGIYRLFDYGGKLIDRGLAIGTVLSGMSADDLTVQTSVVGQVNLISSFGAELLFWDGGDPGRHDNGAVDGGAGIWRADGRTWTDAIGAVNGAMRPQPGFAVLQGSGGEVTLDGSAGALSVIGIQFAGNGYRLSGDGLMLAGENDRTIIRVGDGSAAGAAISATIAAPLTGTGDLIKTDLGTLTLSGANSYAGNTLIEAGTLIGDAAAIRGNVAAAGRVVFDQASDAAFAGTISGLGGASGSAVKRGAGVLTLGGTSSLDWTIEAGSLVTRARSFIGDAIIGSGASLMFSQVEDGTYAGRLSGQGSLIIAGSTVRLTGDSSGFAGRVRVENGVLNTAGKLGGALTLGTGGWLRGNGALGSVTVTSGGTIAPGDSIGTLSVNGDITFGPGSIYEVEVDPTGIASDLIAATGSAILNGGAVVHIGLNGNYRPQASYTILTAAGGVQGTFADVSSSFAFLDPTLGYGANAVTLTLERNDVDFSDIAVTLNQNEVANALGELSFGNALFDTVLLLDENGARLAFDLLSGEIYPSLLSGFVQDSRFVRGAAVDRMRHFGAAADAELGLRFWMQGLGSRGHLDGDGNAHRLKQDLAGFLMGVDAIADETVQLGAFGGYQQGDANVRAVSSEADIDTYHVGVYAGADLGALGLRAGYAFSWHDADVTRQVAFGSFSDVATGRFDASTAQAFAEIGYRIDFGTARMEPFAQIAQIWVDSERLKEVGGAAALQVARGKMSTGVSTLGARLDQSFTLGLLEANLKLSAGWRHAFNDRLAVMASRFEALSPLAIAGTPIARDAFAADIGLSLALSSRARIDLSYSGDVARKSESHAGRATLSWAF